MNKFIIFALLSLQLLTIDAEAQRCCRGEKYCWGCRHYMDLTDAQSNGLPYGYIDNINYPDTYALPLNYYFNNRVTTRKDVYNSQYLKNCIHYNNHKN
jgi:hypothetical protein